jgi:PAP2 superfamily
MLLANMGFLLYVMVGAVTQQKSVEFLSYSLAGGLAILAASFIRKEKDKYESCCMALVLPVVAVAIAIPFWMTEALHPKTLDSLLYRMDLAIGLDPVGFWHAVQSRPWAYKILALCYQAIPLYVGLIYALERSKQLIKVLVVGSILAFGLYNILPAVGPAHIEHPAGFPRNCFPSMHLGWTLIVAWNVRHRWLKATSWVFVALTALATVGVGEHYFIDLIVAVPFCYAVQLAVVAWTSRRGFASGTISQAE